MRVQAYRNLTRGGYSVMSLEPGSYGRVVQHSDRVVIHNPRFVVQPKGRERVLREGVKNVHAFVRGELGDSAQAIDTHVNVRYNPYRAPTFVDPYDRPVHSGTVAVLDAGGVWMER